MRAICQVDKVDMRINQTGNQELSFAIDEFRPLRNYQRRTDGLNPITLDDNRLWRKHLLSDRVKDRNIRDDN